MLLLITKAVSSIFSRLRMYVEKFRKAKRFHVYCLSSRFDTDLIHSHNCNVPVSHYYQMLYKITDLYCKNVTKNKKRPQAFKWLCVSYYINRVLTQSSSVSNSTDLIPGDTGLWWINWHQLIPSLRKSEMPQGQLAEKRLYFESSSSRLNVLYMINMIVYIDTYAHIYILHLCVALNVPGFFFFYMNKLYSQSLINTHTYKFDLTNSDIWISLLQNDTNQSSGHEIKFAENHTYSSPTDSSHFLPNVDWP